MLFPIAPIPRPGLQVSPAEWRWTGAFWTLLVLGGAIRIWLALKGHSIRHPDEIFQSIEQSHRLVFGYGIRPWEFREGLRWIGTPLLLAPPMLLARWFALGPDFYVPVTRVVLALLSLLPFPIFFALVQRRAGALTAFLACLLPLVWVETLDFSGSTLSEALAAPVLAAALSLALLVDRGSRRWQLVALALLLCLSLCLRFHVAPAIAIAAIVAFIRTGPAQRWTLVVALGVTLAALAGLDLAFGELPFQHVWLNAYRNVVDGVADNFGVEPWWYYFASIWEHWGWIIVPAVLLVLRHIRQTWLFALSALLIVLVFSAIGHKEYRFYFPATVLFTFAVGWALGEAGAWIAGRSWRAAGIAGPVSVLVALALALGSLAPAYSKMLAEGDDNRITAELAASRAPDLCGLDNAIRLNVLGTAGFAYLNRDVPLGAVTPENGDAPDLEHFNYVIGAPDVQSKLAPRYNSQACWAAPGSAPLCLYRRDGGCTPTDLSRDPVSPQAGD